MEQLPASLRYFTSQLQNFTRNTVKLNTLNTQSLASNGTTQLRVALPVNAVANMKSLSMYCDMECKGQERSETAGSGGAAVIALIPRNGPIAVMERVTVSAGGIALDNGPTPYHVIYQMRQNLLSGSQKQMSDDRVLQNSTLQERKAGGAAGANTGDGSTAGDQNSTKSCVVNNFAGFTECHPEYLDLSLLPQIFVTIQVGPASLIPCQQGADKDGQGLLSLGAQLTNTSKAQNVQYALNNIHFTLDVCQIGSGMYSALTERVLAERGSIDIPYPQFQVFRQDGGTNIRSSVSCMSLDRVTGFIRKTGGDDSINVGGPPIKAEDSCTWAYGNRSDNFVSDNVVDYQLTINNSPIPTYRPNVLEAFNYVVCADDRTYSRSRGGGVSSQEMWKKNCWCAHHRLCFDNEVSRISGTNVSSVNAQISFDPNFGTANPTDIQVCLMTEQTSILRCGAGRSCAVVA